MESAVRPLLDAYFSPLSGVQVLAQPGSFYVSSAFSLAVSVIGKELVNRGWDSLTPGEQPSPTSWVCCLKVDKVLSSPQGIEDSLCSAVEVSRHAGR